MLPQKKKVLSRVALGCCAVLSGVAAAPALPAFSAPLNVGASHAATHAPVVSGDEKAQLRQWHRVTLTFDGPYTRETATPNPFRDYRLNVTFSQGDKRFVVPGYYAADGLAGEMSSAEGSKWRAHFAPPTPGEWTWAASFRTGPDVAISDDAAAGRATAFDDAHGNFTVLPVEPNAGGRDFRDKGMLQYVGQRYLRFAGSGEYYLKGGTDSPENLLGYEGFDGTPQAHHRFAAHESDWHEGDPLWHGGQGKGLIGSLNYLSSKGVNSAYFITNKVHPDASKEVFAWIAPDVLDRYDCSKLDQWDLVFSHMSRMGIALHFVLNERESDYLLDNGSLGPQRKLYLRELVARFGYQPALFWNLGEEFGAMVADITRDRTTRFAANAAQIPHLTPEELNVLRRDTASYLRRIDPYQHPIFLHAHPQQRAPVYSAMLGFADIDGPSLQHAPREEVMKWIDQSAKQGHAWVACLDESADSGPMPPGPRVANKGSVGVAPDSVDPDHDIARTRDLWGTLMAGGGGVEWYFGHQYPQNDLSAEDFRTRDRMWDQTRWALEFFHTYLPFPEMRHADELVTRGNYGFAKAGAVYAVYLPKGGAATLDLSGTQGTFSVQWFNPRAGGDLQNGSVTTVQGGAKVSPGNAPADLDKDWAILVRRVLGAG